MAGLLARSPVRYIPKSCGAIMCASVKQMQKYWFRVKGMKLYLHHASGSDGIYHTNLDISIQLVSIAIFFFCFVFAITYVDGDKSTAPEELWLRAFVPWVI